MCSSEPYRTHQLKSQQAHSRNPHAEGTHSIATAFWELRQLLATLRPATYAKEEPTLPAPSSLKIPSVPWTSTFILFLGRILGHLPKLIVSASCCHHKNTWDGWRWGPTTEQIHVPRISQWTCSQSCLTGQCMQTKIGKDATQGAVLLHTTVQSRCHHLTLCIHAAPSSAIACTGCFECCTKSIPGWKSNFSRQIRLTLITGSGH